MIAMKTAVDMTESDPQQPCYATVYKGKVDWE